LTTATSCGSGYTGTKYVTTTTSCSGGTSSTGDTSNCGCANGAPNYPSCTVIAPTMSAQCPASYYSCMFYKQGWSKMYRNDYSGPSCTLTQSFNGVVLSYDERCGQLL
jgi:hypothetical protein